MVLTHFIHVIIMTIGFVIRDQQGTRENRELRDPVDLQVHVDLEDKEECLDHR